jgi:hypothetical protein
MMALGNRRSWWILVFFDIIDSFRFESPRDRRITRAFRTRRIKV